MCYICTEEDKKLAKQKYIGDQQQVMKASPVGLFCTILDTVLTEHQKHFCLLNFSVLLQFIYQITTIQQGSFYFLNLLLLT